MRVSPPEERKHLARLDHISFESGRVGEEFAKNNANLISYVALVGAADGGSRNLGYGERMNSAPADRVVRDNPEKHRFEIDLGDGIFAIAEYTLPEGKIMFAHTEVPKAFEGRGLGTRLIRFALDSARERGLEVIPICPFFAAYIKNHADVQDLLDPAYRRILGLA